MWREESTIRKYQSRILVYSIQAGVSSVPEIQTYAGQDFGIDGEGLTFRAGQSLLLGFNHRNQALNGLRQIPKTWDHPNLVAAVQRGVFMARKWEHNLPRDVGEAVSKNANMFQT